MFCSGIFWKTEVEKGDSIYMGRHPTSGRRREALK
jgi:hypothetical protein